ncbi:GNAT family N-acetyltransferase [Arthrobacter tumbae]|uniref:GNAT family N-acetyltransferase n=1 Tax=Arthrobacter tumbae TaxID=163874 RepID=UPI00195CAEED|nr:GNAT family N-acetyltransferase [Arthrobacter tumbae]MBM7780531.1 RimJ/RimL family protein N-acetyltransferase [Arthrobacter tumbae]
MTTLSDVWPLFDLRIRSPRLELRPVRDEDLPGVIDAALAGIHDPNVMPFSVPWTDAPREVLIRETAKHQWRIRTSVEPDNWTLNFVVRHKGIPIGIQDMTSRHFSITRSVTTGSWLSRDYQGQGLGKEMRAAVLLFAFDHLGAEVAESDAAVWNQASLGVSRSLGYQNSGIKRVVARPGELTEQQGVRLAREDFIRPAWNVRVEGLEAARRDLL